jgi:PiT family inorganic phosphate transporter
MLPLLLPILLLALSIGAGDTSNSISTLVGSRLLNLRRALLLSTIFLILGLLLEGWKVGETVAKGLVTGEGGFLRQVPGAVFPICLSTFLCSIPFLLLGFPVSTTQTLLASLAGTGLTLGGSFRLELKKFELLLACWALAPLISLLLSYLLAHLFFQALRRAKNLLALNRMFVLLLPLASAYVAYTNGANDGGTLLGIATSLGSGPLFVFWLGLMVAAGSLLLSRRVVITVGTRLTRLDPFTALPAQLAAALTVWSFVQTGFPVSLTQALTGSVIGVGLTRGTTAVNIPKTKRILIVWVLSPLMGFGLSLLLSLPLSP